MELKKEVITYNRKVRALGLRDHQVQVAKLNPIVAFGKLIYRVSKLVLLAFFVLPGTFLFSLVFLATKLISIRKAREALAASNVKVQARDVMATWKLLVAMVAAPMAYIWYICLGLAWYKYNNVNGWLPDGIRKRWLIPAQFVIYVGITYGALRFGEVAMDIWRSLGPLWKAMISGSELSRLQQRRQDLAQRVNDLINELGPVMYDDFHSKRIVEDPFSKDADSQDGPRTPPPLKSDADAAAEGPQDIETYDYPTSPTSPSNSRNEAFDDLANQEIFSSRPHTPKKSRSRNASSANLFKLQPFSTITGNLEEVQKRLNDGVRLRKGKRTSDGANDFESDDEELTMKRNEKKRGTW